jgi:beta-glucanase (GH16 family)
MAGLSALMVLAGLSCSSASGQQQNAAPPWKQVWTDSFNGPADSGVNAKYWEYNTGHGVFGTNEVETMTPSKYNVHLDGHGNLDIIVLGHGAAGNPKAAWTSGRIETRSNRLFGAPAGGEMMVTASIKQPQVAHGLGYWPGFWMLGRTAWPETGEMDILENVNGYSKTSGTLHCGNLTQRNPDGTFGPCHETNGLGSGLRTCTGCVTSFHTYSVIVDRRHAGHEQIRWYLDGHQFYSVSESRVGTAAWTAGVDHGHSILFSLAMGGAFPDAQCRCTAPTSQTQSGGNMVVRYVRVYTN